MDNEYYEITSELDAREVLRYLNNLGIHNVTGEVLKYFISDLKKLIKYDLQNRSKDSHKDEDYELKWSERLHSASTFASRKKSKTDDGSAICSRECQITPTKPYKTHKTHSAPNLGHPKAEVKPMRRACSCIHVQKKSEAVKEKTVVHLNNNLIKVPKLPAKKKCDPVSLYHYYTSMWAKYKPNVPGENDWSELRWRVRQKMAGNVPEHIILNKLANMQMGHLMESDHHRPQTPSILEELQIPNTRSQDTNVEQTKT